MATIPLGRDDEKLTVALPNLEGDGVDEYEIDTPTPEQLLLLPTSESSSAAVMTLLEQVFDRPTYLEIRRRLGLKRGDPARLTLDNITDIVDLLMDARTGFPTEPSGASSAPRASAGKRSTGRVHSPASTPSASVPAAS